MKKIYSLLLLFICALQGVLANQQQETDYYYDNGAEQYSNDYQYNVYNQPVASKSVSSKGKVWKVIGAVVGVVVVIVLVIFGYKYRNSLFGSNGDDDDDDGELIDDTPGNDDINGNKLDNNNELLDNNNNKDGFDGPGMSNIENQEEQYNNDNNGEGSEISSIIQDNNNNVLDGDETIQ